MPGKGQKLKALRKRGYKAGLTWQSAKGPGNLTEGSLAWKAWHDAYMEGTAEAVRRLPPMPWERKENHHVQESTQGR